MSRKVEFYELPRTLQDQLLAGFRSQYGPRPILFHAGVLPTANYWFAASAIALVLLVVLAIIGYGNLDSGLSSQPLAFIAAYVLLAAALLGGILQGLALRAVVRGLPFAPGLYLFPANVIDARLPRLRVHPLTELADVSLASGRLVLRFADKQLSLAVDPAAAEQIAKQVEQARQRVGGQLDAAARRSIDPLEPPVIESPLGPTQPFAPPKDTWLRLRWVIAAGAGLAMGAGLYVIRDRLSDARMYATAVKADDVATYERYLTRGSRFRDDVGKVLLPRAALRAATADGSVEAIDAFIAQFPETNISQEVELARQKALVAAFEKARADGSLAALTAFDDKYRPHHLDKFIQQARHAVYVKALADYRTKMPEEGAGATLDAVKKLLTLAEKIGPSKVGDAYRGPAVEVRARRLESEDLDRADDLVMKSPMYRGKPSLPTRHLTPDKLAAHEKRMAADFAKALSQGFASEVLTFAAAEPLSGKDNVPPPKVPMLVFTYRVEPSGAAFASKNPLGIFIGLGFFFQFELYIPGESEPMKTKYNFAQSIPTKLLTGYKKGASPEPLETQVYQATLEGAFEDARDRYLKRWFAESAKK